MSNPEEMIPFSVLADFQNRTVLQVANLKWDDEGHTSLTCNVLFAELQPLGLVPHTVTADEDTRHGAQIWAAANAGEYGSIAEYVPPTAEERRAMMPEVTKRQLRLTLVRNGISLATVSSVIAAMPEGQPKDEAQIEWEDAATFKRLHPTLLSVADALGLSAGQVDTMWAEALTL